MARQLLLAAVVAALAGCTFNDGPTTKPMTARERQDAALRDPMGYSPDMSDTNVSGGGIGNLDSNGLKRDVKRVLDP